MYPVFVKYIYFTIATAKHSSSELRIQSKQYCLLTDFTQIKQKTLFFLSQKIKEVSFMEMRREIMDRSYTEGFLGRHFHYHIF